MSIIERNILITNKDAQGNTTMDFPITKKENVEGLEEALENIDIFPVGAILPFSGNTVPVGYLTCNGAEVSRTLYADLFEVIGTTYGAGDGNTTFNLPNLGNNIVSDISTGDLAVVGNGIALGLTNGAFNFALNYNSSSGNSDTFNVNSYGKTVGNVVTPTIQSATNHSAVGVTTDASKSGLVAKMTATKTSVKYIIKAFASITNGGNVDAENIMGAVEGIQSTLAEINDISDYIVESYVSGTEWYRKWKSGWLEQGGQFQSPSSPAYPTHNITFLHPFADTPVRVVRMPISFQASDAGSYLVTVDSITSTGFYVQRTYANQKYSWYACGQGA